MTILRLNKVTILRLMQVATWLCALLLVGLSSSLGLVPNYVVLV